VEIEQSTALVHAISIRIASANYAHPQIKSELASVLNNNGTYVYTLGWSKEVPATSDHNICGKAFGERTAPQNRVAKNLDSAPTDRSAHFVAVIHGVYKK
jgi:hypothetical protein